MGPGSGVRSAIVELVGLETSSWAGLRGLVDPDLIAEIYACKAKCYPPAIPPSHPKQPRRSSGLAPIKPCMIFPENSRAPIWTPNSEALYKRDPQFTATAIWCMAGASIGLQDTATGAGAPLLACRAQSLSQRRSTVRA